MDTKTKALVVGAVAVAAAAGAALVWKLKPAEPVAAPDTLEAAVDALETMKAHALDALRGDLGRVFDNIDTNGDGVVDAAELAAALKTEGGQALVRRINRLYWQVGLNATDLFEMLMGTGNPGSISRKQFVSAFGTHVKLAELFAAIDTDQDGTLSKAEVVAALKDNADLMYELTSHSQTNVRLFQRMDSDGDGKITLSEFVRLFLTF